MTDGEHAPHVQASPVEPASALTERNGAWRLLLPGDVDGVVALVDLDADTATGFRRSYPDAVTVSSDEAALAGAPNARWWDGKNWPLAAGTVALLVADERRADAAALVGALGPDGIRAAIVPASRRHDLVPYPSPDALERIVRRGWPATTGALRQRVRERLATSPAWRFTGRAGLVIEGSTGKYGVADEVVADVGRAVSTAAELRGYLVSGGDNVVLRVGLPGSEVAVRIAITDLGAARLAQQRGVLDGILAALTRPDLRAHMPEEVALGFTHGRPWRAESWQEGHLSTRGARWRPRSAAWIAAHHVARLLADTAPTGSAGAGWARAWAREMDQFGSPAARAIEAALRPAEEAGVPTSWCHGDLWPGNVVLSRGSAVLIDWEQGRPQAPLGVDGVFLELFRLMVAARISFGEAAARAVAHPEALIAPPDIAGVPWLSAPPPIRAAVVTAAAVVHALGPKGDRRGPAWAQENIVPLLFALADGPA